MKDWYLSLEEREQWFVLGGGIFVVVALLWALVWVPLDKGHRERANAVATWERSIAELRPIATRISAGPTAGQPRVARTNETPVVVVDRTLRSRGLDRSLKRSQPTTGNGIRVEFENVAFDELVVWLGDLSSQHSMNVQAGTLSVPPRALPGRVNATLTLERAL